MKADITSFFWDFVNSILTYEHQYLKETLMYKNILYCIDNQYSFSIKVDNQLLEFEAIDDLFYGLLEYYQNRQMEQQVMILESVIEKMVFFVETEEKIDDMNDLFTESFNL